MMMADSEDPYLEGMSPKEKLGSCAKHREWEARPLSPHSPEISQESTQGKMGEDILHFPQKGIPKKQEP